MSIRYQVFGKDLKKKWNMDSIYDQKDLAILSAGILLENSSYIAVRVVEVACWAHARRKFHDVHVATGAPIARQALERIGKLFEVERAINGKPPDERARTRRGHSRPLLDALKAFFEASLRKLPGKSDLAAAIRYALTRWIVLPVLRIGSAHPSNPRPHNVGRATLNVSGGTYGLNSPRS